MVGKEQPPQKESTISAAPNVNGDQAFHEARRPSAVVCTQSLNHHVGDAVAVEIANGEGVPARPG